jgi:hypothetical protein
MLGVDDRYPQIILALPVEKRFVLQPRAAFGRHFPFIAHYCRFLSSSVQRRSFSTAVHYIFFFSGKQPKTDMPEQESERVPAPKKPALTRAGHGSVTG